MIERIKQIAAIVTLALVSVLLSIVIYYVWIVGPKVYETVSHVSDTSQTASEFLKFQTDVVRSPAYQKNIEHSSEVGDLAAKTIVQFARRTLPRFDRTLDELTLVATSLRAVSDEARVQVKQNGDATAQVVGTLDISVKDLTAHTTKLLDDGSLMIQTTSPQLQAALDHLDKVIVTADGTLKAYEPVGVNLAGITGDFNAMTTDSRGKLHEIFYPAPKRGWARAGQIVTYFLRPVFDGARLYYSLTALPVRLTQPIPLPK